MLDALSKGFKSAREKLSGRATLDESNIKEALRDVRRSLLEADVEFNVVKRFLARVEEQATGEVVQTKVKAKGEKVKLSAADHFINICHDELVALMGPVDTSVRFKRGTSVSSIMMVGLQGAGKTTTVGKLARKLQQEGHKPLLVAADIYRPAAVEQLRVLGAQLDIPVFHQEGQAPPILCELALREARFQKNDVVIFDTAGRLTIDDVLMTELEQIKARTRPDNIFLVLDAMTGQDAVRTAKAFDERLDITGNILTKLDGDARGGAALSVKEVTGKPIKFLGIGETLEKLEEFRPEGLADRILGFGDIVGLVKDFEGLVDEAQAEEDAKKILTGNFTLETFLEQIRTIKKMGSLRDLLDRIPFMGDAVPQDLDESQLTRVEAIIQSMTKRERRKPEVLSDASRLRRIAAGSGTTLKEVRELLQRFYGMRNVMKQVGKQPGLLGSLPGFKQLGMLKQLRGGQMGDMLGEMGDLTDLLGDMAEEGKGGGPAGRAGAPKRRGPAAVPPEVMRARVEAKKRRRAASKKAAKARRKKKRK